MIAMSIGELLITAVLSGLSFVFGAWWASIHGR